MHSWIRELMGRDEASPQELVERGIALEEAGRVDEAGRCYRLAIGADACNAAAYFNLGLLLLADEKYGEAAARLREAVRLREPFPEACVAYADALEALGRDAEALQWLERAIAQREGYEGALMNAGGLLQKMGRLDEAAAMYCRAIEAAPESPAAHNNLGNVLMSLGRRVEAEASFRRTLSLEPGAAVAHSNLANALRELGRHAEAEVSAREAVRLAPDLPEAHYNLGNILQAQGRASESVASLRRAIELRPAYREARNSLGNSFKDLGRLDEAEQSFLPAMALDPGDRDARSNFLLLLNYTSKHSRAKVHAEHLEWAARHEAPLVSMRSAHRNGRDPGRRLRIGYVSGDFRRHSVAYFIEPVLERHDRKAFEVYCYSNVALPDPMTARLLGLADHARNIFGMGDTDAAKTVRDDGIDLLVDLSGHTAGNRLGLFALRPAPVQATYLGYPNTTGLGAIGWRITDVHADPPGDGDEFHSERLARLRGSFLSFQPPADSPGVQAPPSIANGFVTFGSFNVLPKIGTEVIRTWARLLERVPRSRLLLKALGLGDPGSRAQVIEAFGREGVPAGRISVLPMEPSLQAHLARYHEMDIALDPFPYNGATTTLEALWMGVPVVALAGDRHSGRVGASILANAGLANLVARDVGNYVDVAAGLAGDAAVRSELRRAMRGRIAASPLLDRVGFMLALEGAYREMWKAWCAGSDDPVEP